MSLLKNIVYRPLDFCASRVPASLREPMGRGIVPWTLLRHGGLRGIEARLREASVEYGAESSARASFGQGELRGLVERCAAARVFRGTLPSGWNPAPEWAAVVDKSWQPVLEALEKRDDGTLDRFLGELFRSDAIAGLWGGTDMHRAYFGADTWNRACRSALFLGHYRRWKEATDGDVGMIEAAPVGRPWGWRVEGRLVIEPTLEYDAEAVDTLRLLEDVEHPVILEIGGGFGGFALQILRRRPDAIYLGFDLVENALVQTCFLRPALPNAKVELHEGDGIPELVPGSATLFPAWKLRDIPPGAVDVATNFRSFSEIHHDGLAAIFSELDRIAPRWILHENVARPRRDGSAGIVVGDFPALPKHALISDTPSSWARYGMDSKYSCNRRLMRLRPSVPAT